MITRWLQCCSAAVLQCCRGHNGLGAAAAVIVNFKSICTRQLSINTARHCPAANLPPPNLGADKMWGQDIHSELWRCKSSYLCFPAVVMMIRWRRGWREGRSRGAEWHSGSSRGASALFYTNIFTQCNICPLHLDILINLLLFCHCIDI